MPRIARILTIPRRLMTADELEAWRENAFRAVQKSERVRKLLVYGGMSGLFAPRYAYSICLDALAVKKPGKKTAKKKTTAQKGTVELRDGLLTGWSTIAKYLGQPTAVAQRWGKTGMPVARRGRSITASPEQVEKWLAKNRAQRQEST